MPNWKKLIVSGSDANLNSLIVNNNISASSMTSSFTGSLEGTSSFALNVELLDGTGSATFATTGSNEFIGNQVITGSVSVDASGEVFVNSFPLYEQALQDAFTGIVSGGVITVNGDNPQAFNISAGAGYVIDNYSDPENPQYIYVSWPELIVTASAFPGPGQNSTTPRTNIAIDSSGNVFEQPDKFSAQDYREKIVLGRIIHVTSPVITRTLSLPLTTYNRGFHWFDLANSIGPINITGNVYSAGGTNRTIQKSAGQTYRVGTNYAINPAFPDITTDSGTNPTTFRYRFRSGSNFVELAPTTFATGSLYDNGSGTLQTVNNNQWTVQRIFFFAATGTTIIQFGQNVYNSEASAQLAALNEPFITDPNLAEDAILRSFLIIRGGATNLSNPTDAEFLEATGGGSAGGGAGGVVTSLESLSDVQYVNALADGQTIVRSGSIWVNGFPTTASFASNATSASFATTATSASFATSASSAISSSFATSASFATTASFANNAQLLNNTGSATFATTGSNVFIGTQVISGSLEIDTDTIVLSGSLEVSGSILLTGSLEVTEDIIGNLDGTASFALTASYIDGGFY